MRVIRYKKDGRVMYRPVGKSEYAWACRFDIYKNASIIDLVKE